MDIEKLIEQLSARGLRNGSSLGYHSGLFDEAATALSTLQDENKRLKNKLSELAHLPFDEPGIGERTRLMAENAELRAELEQVKQKYEEVREAICTHCMDFPCREESCFWWRGQKEE